MNDDLVLRLRRSYVAKRKPIRYRLSEFRHIFENGDDVKIFEELAFCVFTAGASAKMGLKSLDSVKEILMIADAEEFSKRLKGVHRFPNSRANYIFHTREYLKKEFDFKLKELILLLGDPIKRRDFFANYGSIKGLGYKEASHFLRNIGFRGYAILDKHILRTLHEFGLIDDPKPPTSRSNYMRIERKLKKLAALLEIDFDELDLLLWSEKTGEILK
ncbi:MAG: N-glycosylase/DNA lyase [Deltaproteobacteria bacterium]|nr:N-glycosylase/DNA lyase [Deltaproteobacteria bacterium]